MCAGRLTVVDRPAKARVVDHDTVHRRVGVGFDHRRFQRMLLHTAQLVADAVARAGLFCPTRVHDSCLVVVGKEAHQLRPVVASSDDLIRVALISAENVDAMS